MVLINHGLIKRNSSSLLDFRGTLKVRINTCLDVLNVTNVLQDVLFVHAMVLFRNFKSFDICHLLGFLDHGFEIGHYGPAGALGVAWGCSVSHAVYLLPQEPLVVVVDGDLIFRLFDPNPILMLVKLKEIFRLIFQLQSLLPISVSLRR